MKFFRDVASIEGVAKDFAVISFDIFDTLLSRCLPKPADVFSLVESVAEERGVDAEGFREMRIVAERSATTRNPSGKEITLAQIYEELPFPEKTKNILMGLELEVESRVLVPNEPMVALTRHFRELGKIVVVASDMYLPGNFLYKILEACGVSFDKLYVSSEIGVRKSRGALYDFMVADLGVEKRDILHVGDNLLSDVVSPRRKGLAAIWYRPRLASVPVPSGSLAELICSGIAMRPYAHGFYSFKAIGFSYLGPFLVGLCQWIHEEVKRCPGSTLHFLSRDGYIISKAYKLFYPDNSANYTYVSRRCLTVPLLTDVDGWSDVVERVPYIKRHETMASLLEKVGLDDESLIMDLRTRYGNDIARTALLDGTFDHLFDELCDRIRANAADERKAMDGYLAQEMGESSVLVDVGWYGTIQLCLERAVGRPMHGLYVGLLRHNPDYALDNAKGYVYDYRTRDRFDSSLVFSFNGLIETFFSAPHGSVRRYCCEPDGRYVPVFAEAEMENARSISELHDGALAFVEEYVRLTNGLNISLLCPEYSFAGMERLLVLPTLDEVELLGGLWFYDASFDPLVCYEGFREYVHNPKKAIRDFARSNWKMGFLRRLLPTAAAARSAYCALIRIRGKDR